MGETAEAINLSPNTFYRIQVVAQNGASRFIQDRSVEGSSTTLLFRTSEAGGFENELLLCFFLAVIAVAEIDACIVLK